MKRYMPMVTGNGTEMKEHGLGLFVLHTDAEGALAQLREALAAQDKEIVLLKSKLQLADALRNRERGLPPDVITVQAEARIADWEGSRGIVTPADEQGKDESK